MDWGPLCPGQPMTPGRWDMAAKPKRENAILPFAQSEVARKRLPGAQHVALEGAGHVPMSDAPDEIVALIEKTIADA